MSLLDDESIARGLDGVAWERDGDSLVKTVRRDDFVDAMGFVNEVAGLSEAMNYHPDIDIRWNTVRLRLSTHSSGGITEKDLSLARQIDGLG